MGREGEGGQSGNAAGDPAGAMHTATRYTSISCPHMHMLLAKVGPGVCRALSLREVRDTGTRLERPKVHIPIPTTHCSPVSCHCWGDTGSGDMEPLSTVLQILVNL